MNLRPELRAAPAYHFSARPQAIKLDQNESPYDLPEPLKEAALTRLKEVAFNRYPDINAQSLKTLLAERLDVRADSIVVSGGSNILIQALVTAAGLGRTVLTVAPTFSVYPLQANLQGADLVERALREDFSLPLDALLETLRARRGVFFLANPAAPTGNLFTQGEVERLAQASARDWLFVIDEAYHQFSGSDFSYLVRSYDHVVCLRTFSKAFGLGGVRLGYAVMQARLAEHVQKLILPFSVSALQIAVGETVLGAADYSEARIREAIAERERLFEYLSGLPGVEPFPSSANFVLFRVGDAKRVYEGLLDRGVVIRRQDHLPGLTGCLRVSVGKPPENDAFMAAIGEVQSKQGQGEQGREVSHG